MNIDSKELISEYLVIHVLYNKASETYDLKYFYKISMKKLIKAAIQVLI